MLRKARNAMQDNKGFTLMELIVVIAIIAILLTLAVPRLMGYMETARETSDEQLATLYRTTFSAMVNGGTALPLTAAETTAGRTAAAVTILVTAPGAISYDAAADAATGRLFTRAAATGLYSVEITNALLATDVQQEFLDRNGRGGGATPNFQSRVFSNGITITITEDGNVTVAPTVPPVGA